MSGCCWLPFVKPVSGRPVASWMIRYGGSRSLVGSSPFRLARVTSPEDAREKAVMSAPDAPLTGDELLAAVTEATVALHQRYHHRKPVSAKTLLLGGDLLACVLGGVYTDVEKTMIEIQRTTVVQETRSALQTTMQHKFIAVVERLSGRDVLAFISNHHVGPDIEIELFMLAGRGLSGSRH
jgi:uncharacterized protein YbcI